MLIKKTVISMTLQSVRIIIESGTRPGGFEIRRKKRFDL